MTVKTFRAVQQGYHAGRLINPEATFTVDTEAYRDEFETEFEPNWAVEVHDGHAETPGNVGDQEQLNVNPAAALPTIAREDQPLAQFHPTVAQAIAVEQASAENGDPSTPVKSTAELLAEQAAAAPKKRKSARKPGESSIDTGTDASEAEKAEATDASKAEVEAGENAEKQNDEGHDLV
jgi:hypothetical protein